MQTPNQPPRESPFFTKISNIKINPPLVTAFIVSFIAIGFSMYLVYIFNRIKSDGNQTVPIASINQTLDSIRVISSSRGRIDMILTGRENIDTIRLAANKPSKYFFNTRKKVNGETVSVQDSVFLSASQADTLIISKSWKHISSQGAIFRSNLTFVEYPYLLMWAILISLLNSVAWVAGMFLIYLVVQYLKRLEVFTRRKTWIILIPIAAVFLFFNLSANENSPIVYSEVCSAFNVIFKPEHVKNLFVWISRPAELCGVLAAGILLLLPFLSYHALKNLDTADARTRIAAQKAIRNDFILLVTFMSGLILVGLVTNGLMYQVLLNVLGADFKYIMPSEFTFVYGIKYSIVLAIFYFPVYFSLHQAKETLRQSLLDSGATADELDKQLGSTGISTKFWDRFKIIAAALTPLIGSVGMKFVDMIISLH